MERDPNHSVKCFHGEEARNWIEDNLSFVNLKWKRLQIRFLNYELTTICLTYSRNARFFGEMEKNKITFTTDMIQSIVVEEYKTKSPWGSAYRVTISLTGGAVFFDYAPPFWHELFGREKLGVDFK